MKLKLKVILIALVIFLSKQGLLEACEGAFSTGQSEQGKLPDWILVTADFGMRYPTLVTQKLLLQIQGIDGQGKKASAFAYNTKSELLVPANESKQKELGIFELGVEPLPVKLLPFYLKAGKLIAQGKKGQKFWSAEEAGKRIEELRTHRDLVQFHLHTLLLGINMPTSINLLIGMNLDVFRAYFGPINSINLRDEAEIDSYSAVIFQLQLVEFLLNHTIDLLDALVKSSKIEQPNSQDLLQLQKTLALHGNDNKVRTFYGDEMMLQTATSGITPASNSTTMYGKISQRYPIAENTYLKALATFLSKDENGLYVGSIPEPITICVNLYTRAMFTYGLNMHPYFQFLVSTLDFPVMGLTPRE